MRGGAMDVDAEVGAVADSRLARVDAHPHAQLDPLRPRVPGDRTLRLDERPRRRDARPERRRRTRRRDGRPRGRRRARPPRGRARRWSASTSAQRVAELAHERCRAFDVGEDECDRSIGQIGCQSLLQWYLGPDSGSGAGGTLDLKLAV